MATFVRNRVLNQLAWTSEEESARAARREALCELDGLLTRLTDDLFVDGWDAADPAEDPPERDEHTSTAVWGTGKGA